MSGLPALPRLSGMTTSPARKSSARFVVRPCDDSPTVRTWDVYDKLARCTERQGIARRQVARWVAASLNRAAAQDHREVMLVRAYLREERALTN